MVTSAEPTLECVLLPSRNVRRLHVAQRAGIPLREVASETKEKASKEIEAVMTRSDMEVRVVFARKVACLSEPHDHHKTSATRLTNET